MERTQTQKVVKVLVLDAQPVWLRAVEGILSEAKFSTASTTSPKEALRLLARERFDVMMVGVDFAPDFDEKRLFVKARTLRSALKLIVVSAIENQPAIERALKLGADAYVVKRAQPADLVFAVRQVLAPEVYQVRPTLDAKSEAGAPLAAVPRLTAREDEILRHLAQGRPNAEIAKRLAISERTVKGHLSRLYRKIGVPNRTGAARWAQLRGLLTTAEAPPSEAGHGRSRPRG